MRIAQTPKTDLYRIGPGLGSRGRIWKRVFSKLSPEAIRTDIPDHEFATLVRLSEGAAMLDFVDREWFDVHSFYYDDAKSMAIDERELTKIDKDVPRTFGLFVRNSRYMRMNFPSDLSKYYSALQEVLILASRDRGYCQGINFIAASLLLQLADRRQSHILLSFLLKHRRLEILFDPRYSALVDYMKIFEKRLRRFLPRLYKHFKNVEFAPVNYAIE